jgi:F0F1-type ATP synthase alpha subunit
MLDNLTVESVRPFESALHAWLSEEKPGLVEQVATASKFDEQLSGDLKGAIGEFKNQYVKDNPTATVTA